MLAPIKIYLAPETFGGSPPEFYNVGLIIYQLQGKTTEGDLIYQIKKIPKRKLNIGIFAPPPENCCLDVDQDTPTHLLADSGDRLCPDQGCA